jgi:hypothetical protein
VTCPDEERYVVERPLQSALNQFVSSRFRVSLEKQRDGALTSCGTSSCATLIAAENCGGGEGEHRTVQDFRVIPYDIPPRCAATYYPETNPPIALGSVVEIGNTPAFKSTVITVQPSDLRL